MNDIFGKAVSILIAAVVFFLLPVLYIAEREGTVAQLYLMTETAYFVDSVCNTGVLTEQMYRKYEQEVLKSGGFYEIKMMYVRSMIYGVSSEKKESRYYTNDILEELEREGEYLFPKDTFFKVELYQLKPRIGERILELVSGVVYQIKPVVFYGGTIKFER